ncbi:MAG: hypothetical protein RR998_02465 [Oscillospiraceae bacterium]
MLPITITTTAPTLETTPVFKTTCYPWANGSSFRPLCYARCAIVEGQGMLVDLQAFERSPEFGSADLLDDSCVAVAFDFFPERGRKMLIGVFNAKGQYLLFADESPLDYPLDVASYAGEDEQGWYWGIRVTLPHELLKQVFGSAKISDGHTMLGNFYKFKRTGNTSHLGAVCPANHDFIFSHDNLSPFAAVSY